MSTLIEWFKRLSMSPAERYLSQATDHYDLEQRQKELRYKGIWV